MKVSEKQLLMLMDITKDTLRIANVLGGYDLQTRLQLVNDLINQQSNDLKEIDEIKPNKNVKVPEYDELSEGCDPSIIKKKKLL